MIALTFLCNFQWKRSLIIWFYLISFCFFFLSNLIDFSHFWMIRDANIIITCTYNWSILTIAHRQINNRIISYSRIQFSFVFISMYAKTKRKFRWRIISILPTRIRNFLCLPKFISITTAITIEWCALTNFRLDFFFSSSFYSSFSSSFSFYFAELLYSMIYLLTAHEWITIKLAAIKFVKLVKMKKKKLNKLNGM